MQSSSPLTGQVEEPASISKTKNKYQRKYANRKHRRELERKSAVFDTGATSSCGREGDDFIPTNQPSNKVFHVPTGHVTRASMQAKLHHKVREPARTVDMVPGLKHNSLISGGKFADANYVTILTPTQVLIYDNNDLTISVNCDAILRGWRDKQSGLWRVPLQEGVAPPDSEYILLDAQSKEAIINV